MRVKHTNPIAQELARLHGSHEKALAFRTRNLMGTAPADGSGKLTDRIIMISDVHIGAGRDPETGAIHPADDFTAEQSRQFTAYLTNEWQAARLGNSAAVHPTKRQELEALNKLTWADGSTIDVNKVAPLKQANPYRLTLTLAGDFLDFLQTTVERAGMPYPDGILPNGAPKNTPANSLVKLNVMRQGHPEVFRTLATHLRLGHRIDVTPGNHDLPLANPHVWQGEIEVNGKKLGGFTRILAQELAAMGASPEEIKQCMQRVSLKPVAFYGDAMVSHGMESDVHNRTQRPHKEFVDPTPLHGEFSLSYGDVGVQNGFNHIEQHDPRLDSLPDNAAVVKRTLNRPSSLLKLAQAFLSGFKAEGYRDSPQADAAQRRKDIAALVDKYPSIAETLNALRPPEERLTPEEIKKGLMAIEDVSATPLFSNFKKGAGFFTRLGTAVKQFLSGKTDKRDQEAVTVDRLHAAHKSLGINKLVQGHTHQARDQTYLTDEEKTLRYVNTHTWMTQTGEWGRPELTWKGDGRGVGVIEIGVDQHGNPWSTLSLHKVADESGDLVEGDIVDDAAGDEKVERAQAQEIFKRSHSVTPGTR